MKIATTQAEYDSIVSDAATSPFVHSLGGWKSARLKGGGIFDKISVGALDRFEQSLRFKGDAFVTADCNPLINEVGEGGAIEVFKLLGIDSDLYYRFKNMKCSGGGLWDCVPAQGYSCNPSGCKEA